MNKVTCLLRRKNMAQQNDTATATPVVVGGTVPVITTMANMINYLNVSLYEGQLRHDHEQSRADLNKILVIVSKKPTTSPSPDLVRMFHSCVVSLKRVTDTDDADYHNYIRQLREYTAADDAAAAAPDADAGDGAAGDGAAGADDDDDDDEYYNNDPREDYTGDWEIDLAQQELRDWTAEIRRNKRFDY